MKRAKKSYSIQPEDKRPDVSFTFKMSAGLRDRIDAYAGALNSSPEYVVRSILTQHLDNEGIENAKERARAISAVA